jgi:hypothetical protein
MCNGYYAYYCEAFLDGIDGDTIPDWITFTEELNADGELFVNWLTIEPTIGEAEE